MSKKKRKIDTKKFVVVDDFRDLQDNNKIYTKGDEFPTKGKTVARIKELSTTKNKLNKVLIKEQE